MKKRTHKYLLTNLILWVSLYLISRFILNNEYLFGWIAKNWKFYGIVCLLPLFFLIFGKRYVSVIHSFGIFIGAFIGNYFGAFLLVQNVQKITSDMSQETQYRLNTHRGFEIWMVSIFVAMIVGFIVERYMKKKETMRYESL